LHVSRSDSGRGDYVPFGRLVLFIICSAMLCMSVAVIRDVVTTFPSVA
jgi:hypothetical protein